MRKELAPYVEMVEFLGEALGREYEIVLHDLTNPERSIVAIANGELSGRGIGGPVTDFALKILKQERWKRNPMWLITMAKRQWACLPFVQQVHF